MNEPTPILADGISPGMIFTVIIAIAVALLNIFAKAKQTRDTQEKMRAQRQGRETSSSRTLTDLIRDQVRREEKQPRPKQATKKNARQRQPAIPPPMPTRVAKPAPRVEPDAVVVSAARGKSNETARNVRLMLQPVGIREAFILSEVLGKPKALRDDGSL